MSAYLKEGLDQEPPCSSTTTGARDKCPTFQDIPKEDWKDLKSINGTFKLNFNNSNIVSYFISRSVTDGLPASDFKAINKSAEYLFRCGHIQSIQYSVSNDNVLYIKSNCLPEMRKDRVYNVCIGLEKSSSVIVFAACGCPAGKGPRGSCKHIAALTYSLSEFYKMIEHALPQTCTDVLQKWNQPRAKKESNSC